MNIGSEGHACEHHSRTNLVCQIPEITSETSLSEPLPITKMLQTKIMHLGTNTHMKLCIVTK